MFSKVGKLCQRQLYTWLSSRCGVPVLVIGLLVAVISLLQFGEVFLEWSKERYAAQFSIYADNIMAKSYEKHLCPNLPIDVVYTWVNGSDQQLLTELRVIRNKLNKYKQKESSGSSNSTSCPFLHCTTWRAMIIDARNSSSLDINSLTTDFPSLAGKVGWAEFVNGTGDHVTSVFAVQLRNDVDVSELIASGILRDCHGNNVSVTEGYLTTDSKLVGGVKLADFGLSLSSGIRPTNGRLLRKWMDLKFPRQIEEVEVRDNGTSVVKFKLDYLSAALSKNKSYQFSGHPLQLHQAYLIWLPFLLPKEESEEKAEQISSNRFQDNEELRYSLRSVEQFAPWVRHVYLVTNGQIPSWLNLENPRITIVTHEEIFPNKSHLPTYSSPAIETHIHRIPGLSDNFIYLNDDVMFGEEVWPEDFYTSQQGQKVFLSWAVPQCADGCPASWITDKYCDQACNNSACDWDGGDCANASRPGPVGGGGWNAPYSSSDHCSNGCLNSWLGDRYCDSACRVLDCGYDAGDCGTERWEELLSYQVDEFGGNFSLPLGTKALFFNLTSVFSNGTIVSADHTPTSLIRTAVVAQKYKTISITLARNVSLSSANFTVTGKVGNDEKKTVNFTVSGDTRTVNKSLVKETENVGWSFNFNNSQSDEFLREVAKRVNNVSSWPNVRPLSPHTSPPPTTFTNYTLTNDSLLPPNVSAALTQLEQVYRDGDLTERGYWMKKVAILEPVKHLVVTNGTIHVGNKVKVRVVTEKVKVHTEEKTAKKKSSRFVQAGALPNRVELLRGGGANGRGLMGTRKLLTSAPLLSESRRRLPWEKWHLFPEANSTISMDTYTSNNVFRTRKLLGEDYFANSLRHVNNLFTIRYGRDARKVPAHMPHFIQKPVMERLQEEFEEYYDQTSSHNVRASDDMQFAFSYFYYLMSEKEDMVLEEVFRKLDTDRSGILSVRELRSLLSMLSELPIEVKTVENFQSMLESCDLAYNGTRPSVEPIEYETHYDPDLPLVTLDFVEQCEPLIEKLKVVFKTRRRYKFEEVDEKKYVIFQMISENSSIVMNQLDHIRKERKKFICLNDNIDHEKPGAELAKLILVDFYETLFPIPSQFELPPQYQNRFLHTRDLREWLKYRDRVQLLLHTAGVLLLLLCIVSLFYGKLLQWKRKVTRYFSNCLEKRTSSV